MLQPAHQTITPARPMPVQPFPMPPRPPKPPFVEPGFGPDLEDILKDLLPGSKKVMPKLDFFPGNESALDLAHQAAEDVMKADSKFEKFSILKQLVNDLNHYDMVLTSYPAKPVYTHSTAELMKLENYLENMPQPKCRCESTEAYQEVLGAVRTALKERQPNPIKFPPFLKI